MQNNVIFRTDHPVRTCTLQYKDYKRYKPFLRIDFNGHCGYCHADDTFLGGKMVYHVDHFAPQKKFPNLKITYANLVYACPYCNRYKSNDWPSDDATRNVVDDKGYIDPCDETYITHFCRNNEGAIVPLTEVGVYMYRKLKFDRKRHQVLWNIAVLKKIIDELYIAYAESSDQNPDLLKKLAEFNKEYHAYFDYINGIED